MLLDGVAFFKTGWTMLGLLLNGVTHLQDIGKEKVFYTQFNKLGHQRLYNVHLSPDHNKVGIAKIAFAKKTKMGSIIGHRIDYKWGRGSERPAALTLKN